MAKTMLKSIAIVALAAPVYAQDGEIIQDNDGYQIELVDEASGSDVEERTHTIRPGDTLWDISQTFWGEAEQWPRMWSYNNYITNPHWIYPGNTIRFTPGTYLSPPTMELDGADEGETATVTSLSFEESEPECGPDMRYNFERTSTVYHSPSFLAERNQIPKLGTIYGAKSGMKNLGDGDLVYIELEDGINVECGDVYSVFRRRPSKVRHPDSWFRKYGYLHDVVAEIRVVEVGEDLVSAVVRQSYEHIQRGDFFGGYIPVTAELPVSIPNGELDAVILARVGSGRAMLAATGETIFIDRGRADGLQVGDAFYVVHRSDDYEDLHGYDERIPSQVAGRIIVTALDEYHATAVVVDAARPINVGDNLAMRIE